MDDADMADFQITSQVNAITQAIVNQNQNMLGPIIIEGVACCRKCYEPISKKRLKALPNAELCIECAKEREK